MSNITALRAIMKALRTPLTGCPWDLEQSFETIAPYTIEEAYEVADAIARGDKADLCEELGDLLLQVVYHAQMAEEQGDFTFDDVVEAISAKMVRRHPHVFGDEKARSAKLAKGFWEEMKRQEKPKQNSVLDGVPAALPGLTRAVKLQAKAAKVGFDWPTVAEVLAKAREELAELEEVLGTQEANAKTANGQPLASTGQPTAKSGQPTGHAVNRDEVANAKNDNGQPTAKSGQPTNREVEEELGDLLFVLANVARHREIDPESAIREANRKFERRFQFIEARLNQRDVKPENSSLAEMDALWDDAKAEGL